VYYPEAAATGLPFARCRVEQGDYAQALKLYQQAIEREPSNASMHENAAMMLSALERHGDAMAQIAEALRCAPESPRVRQTAATVAGRAAAAR